uniref:MATE efflux family protein LAL5-like isoform X1 n=1 Tax=Rhizophora mucronata TaxID=61149 RepID=A0A2P2MA72_RHIMU
MQSTPTSSSSDYANAPLLEGVCGGQERGGWWERNTRKVLDGEEAKTQILFALPMIFTNAFYYLVTLVSVMFAGHLGQLQLAGANLANAWYFATGVSLMVLLHFYFLFLVSLFSEKKKGFPESISMLNSS